MNNSSEMAKIVIAALEDKKAEDIKVIDISGVSVIADYFVIAGGTNRNHGKYLQFASYNGRKKYKYFNNHSSCKWINLPVDGLIFMLV